MGFSIKKMIKKEERLSRLFIEYLKAPSKFDFY